jgi:hypothetical protein
MKNWLYFYIEHTIKNGEPFCKEAGWSLGLKNNYVVLSGGVELIRLTKHLVRI